MAIGNAADIKSSGGEKLARMAEQRSPQRRRAKKTCSAVDDKRMEDGLGTMDEYNL